MARIIGGLFSSGNETPVLTEAEIEKIGTPATRSPAVTNQDGSLTESGLACIKEIYERLFSH